MALGPTIIMYYDVPNVFSMLPKFVGVFQVSKRNLVFEKRGPSVVRSKQNLSFTIYSSIDTVNASSQAHALGIIYFASLF